MTESTKLTLIIAILAFMGCAPSAKERSVTVEPVPAEAGQEKGDGSDEKAPKTLTEDEQSRFQSTVDDIDQLTRLGLGGVSAVEGSPFTEDDLKKCSLRSKQSTIGAATMSVKFSGTDCLLDFAYDSVFDQSASGEAPKVDQKLSVSFEMKDASKKDLVDISMFQTVFVYKVDTQGSSDARSSKGKLVGEGKILSKKDGEIGVTVSGGLAFEAGLPTQTTRIELKYADGLEVVLLDVVTNGEGKCSLNGKELPDDECGVLKGKININPVFSTAWTKAPIRAIGPSGVTTALPPEE